MEAIDTQADVPILEEHERLVNRVGEALLEEYGDVPPEEYTGILEAFRQWTLAGAQIIKHVAFQSHGVNA